MATKEQLILTAFRALLAFAVLVLALVGVVIPTAVAAAGALAFEAVVALVLRWRTAPDFEAEDA